MCVEENKASFSSYTNNLSCVGSHSHTHPRHNQILPQRYRTLPAPLSVSSSRRGFGRRGALPLALGTVSLSLSYPPTPTSLRHNTRRHHLTSRVHTNQTTPACVFLSSSPLDPSSRARDFATHLTASTSHTSPSAHLLQPPPAPVGVLLLQRALLCFLACHHITRISCASVYHPWFCIQDGCSAVADARARVCPVSHQSPDAHH